MRNLLNLLKKQKGFSLTEATIYLAVISMIGVGLITLTLQLVKLKASANAMSIISAEIPKVFDKIILDMRNCDNFSVIDSTHLQTVKGTETNNYYLENEKMYINENGSVSQVTSDLVIVEELEFINWTSVDSDNLLFMRIRIKNGDLSENFETNVNKR